MTMISVVSVPSTPVAYDHSQWMITTFCCAGLIISLCLMAFGVDSSAGWV
jgi:hypothetical protein